MKHVAILLIFAAVASASASPSAASALGLPSVMIDFDSLPPDTMVDSQFPEVKFTTEPGIEIRTTDVPFAPTMPNIICTVPVVAGVTCKSEVYLDFVVPVDLLQFKAIGAKAPGTVAEVEIFQNFSPMPTAIVPIDTPAPPDGTVPIFVDLTTFTNVTTIKIVNVNDPAGIGFDDFWFEPTDDVVFNDGFESGDASAWPVVVP